MPALKRLFKSNVRLSLVPRGTLFMHGAYNLALHCDYIANIRGTFRGTNPSVPLPIDECSTRPLWNIIYWQRATRLAA